MAGQPLSVAFLGGVPASLGGGGLEIQRDRTAEALRRRGHEVFRVELEARPRPFDVLHAFGSEPDVCHYLTHWRTNIAPLVISPVLVVTTLEEGLVRWGARVPLGSFAPRQRATTLRHAQLLVALTRHEAGQLRSLAPGVPVTTIGNGVVPGDGEGEVADVSETGVPERYVLLVGTVSPRKRQADSVRALRSTGYSPVVVGGYSGNPADQDEFADLVRSAGGTWLGELEPGAVRRLVRKAAALIHLSKAEGQSLAVLEAIADGTPVICSPLPSNIELAERYPELVRLCHGAAALPEALAELPARRGTPPDVPTWDSVAERLESHYQALRG